MGFTVQLRARALIGNNEMYQAYYTGDEGVINLQRYLVEGDPKIEITGTFGISLTDNPDEPGEPGNLKIIKLSEGTNAPLGGAVFEVKDPDSAVIFTGATPGSGEISLTLTKPGSYVVTELSAPEYHLLPKNPTQTVYIAEGETGTVTFADSPYGELVVNKADADTGAPLGGVTVRMKHIATNATYTGKTDSSGSIWFEKLLPGAYEIVELTARAGYALESSVHTVNVLPAAKGITSFALTNRANPGLRILKLDRARALPIAGVVFEVFRDGSLYGEYATDRNGEIMIADAPAGTYTAREKSTVEPYVLDATAQWIELAAGGGVKTLIFLNVNADIKMRKNGD
jgi:uncharacterized surface anchored protein